MPSGAKKRKAAKRKKEKEQEEKEKEMGSVPDPPLSPTDDPLPSPSPPAPPPPQPQGNDHKDRMAHDDVRERESGEGIPRSELIVVDPATESSENEKREVDEVEVQGMAVVAAEEALPAPKDELDFEIVQSEKGEPCGAVGAKESAIPVEHSVVASEEVERGIKSLAETRKEASAPTDPPPFHEPQEDVVEEQPRVSGDAGQGSGRAETVPTIEVASRAPQVVHRAKWWNCCGLLDVLVRLER